MEPRQRVMNLLGGRPVDRPPLMPITMMFASRQIGRPYREYAFDHRVLVEGQTATAERFGFDHVSAISDPAREAADCGAAIELFDDQPPALDNERPLLADETTLITLRVPDPNGGGRMTDRVQGVSLLRQQAGGHRIVEGWIESPCAQAADLRGLQNLMMDLIDGQPFVGDLLQFVHDLELRFALAQIEAGADLIGIGDAAASLIGPEIYHQYILPFEQKLIDAIHEAGAAVRLHICGNTKPILAGMAQTGADIIDLDSMVSMAEARRVMGPAAILLGNLHPVHTLLNGSPEKVRSELERCRREAGERYIAGAGCEIPPATPPAHVLAMRDWAGAQVCSASSHRPMV